MSDNQLKQSELYQFNLTENQDSLNYNSGDSYSPLTLVSNQKFTSMNYEKSSVSENVEVVKKLTWEEVSQLLEDGRYWTPSALAKKLDATTANVREVLHQNASKVFTPKHKSPNTGETLFVLIDRRRRVYEILRPVQLASRAML